MYVGAGMYCDIDQIFQYLQANISRHGRCVEDGEKEKEDKM